MPVFTHSERKRPRQGCFSPSLCMLTETVFTFLKLQSQQKLLNCLSSSFSSSLLTKRGHLLATEKRTPDAMMVLSPVILVLPSRMMSITHKHHLRDSTSPSMCSVSSFSKMSHVILNSQTKRSFHTDSSLRCIPSSPSQEIARLHQLLNI